MNDKADIISLKNERKNIDFANDFLNAIIANFLYITEYLTRSLINYLRMNKKY